jgi:hypothetical protein
VSYSNSVSRQGYHGQFEHPVRAFAFGIALILLLGGGFVVGIQAGGKSDAASGVETVVRSVGTLHVVTVPTPVTRTVVHNGVSSVVTVPKTRVVIVKQKGHSVLGFLESGGTTAALSPTTVLVPNAVANSAPTTVTVTETQTETQVQTVTETTTVTDTGTTGTTDTTGTTSGP